MDSDPTGTGGNGDAPASPDSVEAYYRALDEGDYDRLAGLLADGFVHERPDMTLEGRERFVQFMREERPTTGTSHPLDATYRQASGAEIAARGRLLGPDGAEITSFVDIFSFEGNKIGRIRTFVD